MYTMYISQTAWGWTECELFSRLGEFLTQIGKPTRLERAMHFTLSAGWWRIRRDPIEESFAYLQEDGTGRFWVMACDDLPDGLLPSLLAAARDPRCQRILKQQYRPETFRGVLGRKVRPWTYTAVHPGRLATVLPKLRGAERTRRGLYFRGSVGHQSRGVILTGLKQRGLLSTEVDPVPFDTYCAELSAHRLALSLPGWGNLCHREIESFGIGTPVLMPRLLNRLHNDLVPDYHYISVDTGKRTDPENITEAIERRYLEVVDDADLLGRISANAARWYDENAAYPNSLRLTARLLELG
jgi:hypothetical protein